MQAALEQHAVAVPQQVSVCFVGTTGKVEPFTGYYVDDLVRVAAIVQAIQDFQPHRPAAIWLSGQAVDRGTTAPPPPQMATHPEVAARASVALAS